jgi:hypothetical protein
LRNAVSRQMVYLMIMLVLVLYASESCSPSLVTSSVESVSQSSTTLFIYSNVCGFEVWFDGRLIFTAPSDKD